MKLNIDIPDAKITNFSNQAKDELKTQIAEITNNLVDESLRIETSERLKGNTQEVTSSVVQKSAEIFLRRYNSKKGSTKMMYIEILSTVLLTVSGMGSTFAFYDLPNNLWILLISLALFVIGITGYVITIKKKYE